MQRSGVAALLTFLFCATGYAALKPGDPAPDFTVQAALGGKVFTFKLAEALKKGPVVLYFYPKSFTSVCTEEAHDFAENAANFADAHATLIGLSADTIQTQQEFSAKECRDKFPVAADPDATVIRSYDALLTRYLPSSFAIAGRISYVISPDGRIILAHSDSAAASHIEKTLAAVRRWQEEHK